MHRYECCPKEPYLALANYLCVETVYFKWCLIVICFVSSSAHSQLSVVATAGSTGPISYTTLKNAFDAINAGTHNGAITITVNGSTNETATAILKKTGTGAASYSSVLLKPASLVNPTISAAMANPIIILDGASNVTIDGSNATGGTTKDLTISNSAVSSLASAIILVNGASVNVIKNSVIQSAVTDPGATLIVSTSTAPQGNNNNTIENNDITKSSGGVPFFGILNIGSPASPNTRNIYRNNRIFNFLFHGFSDGDDSGAIGFSDSTLIEGNEFYNTITQPIPVVGIFVRNETGIRNMTISRNKIHSLTTTSTDLFGILLYDAVSVTVDNNMISLANSPSDVVGIGQETGSWCCHQNLS